MRRRDPRLALADIVSAGELAMGFLAGRTFEQYASDRLLSSAVERQLEIVGEAVNRALRADPALQAEIPQAAAVIGFRNILAHGYDTVSDRLVFSLATENLPPLVASARELLARY